jgi:hypothetical protein
MVGSRCAVDVTVALEVDVSALNGQTPIGGLPLTLQVDNTQSGSVPEWTSHALLGIGLLAFPTDRARRRSNRSYWG